MYYIGLDVHKKTISYCVKDASGQVHQEGKVGATRRELDSWIKTLPQPRTMAMEATIFTGWIYDHLLPHAQQVAEDFSWTITGSTKWSKKYDGKRAVIEELFGALRTKLVSPIVVEAYRFIADEDYVVVEARGRNTTKAGVRYNNIYCYVFHLADGKLQEMTEYLDTELVTAALGAPVTNSDTNN